MLAAQYQLGVQLKGVIYIHRITDIRYSRSSVKTFEIFKKVCGDTALKNVLLVTSRWNEVKQSTGADRERQLKDKFWAYMLGRGSNMSRFHGDRDSAISLISQLLCKDEVVLELQKELVDQGKRLDETVAGSYVTDNLDKLKKQYEDELASLERLRKDLLDNERDMKRRIQKDWEAEQARLVQVRQQQEALQRPIGSEVRQKIEKKRSGLGKVLPFLPMTLGILGSFVGIPPEFTSLLTSWFGDLTGIDFGFSDC